MMFRKTNEELDLAGLDNFIEKPSQECNEEELKNGVSKVLIVLNKNPAAIMNIIATHPFIAATFLLDDLADKMKKQNCIENLGALFDKCLDNLVEACVYNVHDLGRCVQVMPSCTNKVIENILANEHRVKRILEADKNPLETLKEVMEKYPNYKEKFSEFYNRHFNVALSLKQ